jgi:hypothetical protein
VTTLTPRLNYYAMAEEPIPTPSVREANIDLYLNLMAFERDGSSATVNFFLEPLVIWIWIGSVIMATGAGIALWPDRRRNAPKAPVRVARQPLPQPARRSASSPPWEVTDDGLETRGDELHGHRSRPWRCSPSG